ncbi:DUF2933 domain-containing protein [Paraburkholderia sp. LEh10]|uniref:DUF2933 domain-containing protein n=1 Tax=Paraburkholderia sp. LEh10 TaxID=2821353 RepID=UPI001AE92089|nr:DUF2933 domain-containing protein [Paraburkholderia sp. LEh10]MBP0595790.1 DUF2933 domain-containing protein [Paraburkholderia sp. LEh10]
MQHGNRRFGFSGGNIVLVAFIAIGGFYLVTEHRAHLLGWLPFLLLLACPLMHLFMHHGDHGGDASRPEDEDKTNQNQSSHSHHH